MKRKRRNSEEFNISFLDVICCGFGAIVLLLMITKTLEPIILENSAVNLDGQVADLQKKLFEIRGETNILNRDLNAKHEQISLETQRIAILKTRSDTVESVYAELAAASAIDSTLQGKLELALQQLTEEMQRLLGEGFQRNNDLVGGIPVDSEYIVFIIDTSGSMFDYAWDRVVDELVATLEIYPQVKGIQVMNDMGDYMFSNYRGQWIPDTPGRRSAVIRRLRTWNPFSNSSPVEGIQRAVRTFYDPNKKISLYVFGDDFRGRSIREVVKTVDRLNRERKPGERMVRIHAVGFPVQFTLPLHLQTTGFRFAALMRELAYRNGGTFVGLNDYRPQR
ncbi:VWA domain-containing protein [Exilibacterium tricleocarpae]|uniref:VWA domain-containing protein n=1 Tax=Exilibacterium tricleocarpae TaxID=2591008 RepID=A0A545U591_9GAMM|nr:vWA domain-containing protein [Exilibacterium tricleocarpae]TQV84636.1 VWA domain-containing protein [Exilibacterium tricleocarpae]